MAELGDILGTTKKNQTITDEQLSPTGAATYFEVPIDEVIVNLTDLKINQGSYNGSGVFILGHPTFGVLGSQKLGFESTAKTTTRILESYHYIDYDEDFLNTVYENVGSTTASGWGSGSLIFSSGDSAQTISLGSDIQLSSTRFNRGIFFIQGSYTQLLQGSFSFNNGSDWTGVYHNKEIIVDNSISGSEPIFRMYDPVGSVSLTNLNIIIKQDDF